MKLAKPQLPILMALGLFSFKRENLLPGFLFSHLPPPAHPTYVHLFSEQVCISLPFLLISQSPKNSCSPNLPKAILPRIGKHEYETHKKNKWP